MTDAWDADGPVRPAPEGASANAVPPPAAWSPLLDVDTRAVQPLLESLEDAGVAAYAAPVRAGHERVHVDATLREVAEAVVSAELPGLLAELSPEEPDVDPFDAIVAGWDAVPEAASWPEAEDVRPAHKPERVEAPAPPKRRYDPDSEHYVPPPPPPVELPKNPVTRYAVAAVVFGLLAIVVLPLLGIERDNSALLALGAISLIAGVGTLIWRMRDAPSVDDGPDDGAVL